MFRVETSQRITKYILLSLLCFDVVFSAVTETAQKWQDDEDGDIYGEDGDIHSEDGDIHIEDGDILRNDFHWFTTRKRYVWEDWTVPTSDYRDYGGSSGSADFVLYVFVPIFIVIFIITAVYICIKNVQNNNCCSVESDSYSSMSANRFTTVHRPPERRRDLSAQVHRPPTGRNQLSDSRRELFGEPVRSDLFNGPYSNRGVADTTGATISYVDYHYGISSLGISEPDNTVGERPPDYSTVTMNDLVNPSMPAFPAVKKDNESPPPAYDKENPFFK